MTAFDPELYLRLTGERMLASGTDRWDASPLTVAAQALVAVGCVDDAAVVSVLEDYVLAAALRGDSMSRHSLETDQDDEPASTVAVGPLTPARVVACDAELEIAGATLHVSHVTLGREVTTLAVVLRFATPGRRRHAGSRMRGGLPGVTLTDDRGTRTIAQFSGGGSDSQWEGHFHAEPGLDVDAAYIDVDGHRIDLAGGVGAAEVWIEDLPAQAPALRHLWQCVTPEGHMRESVVVEPAVDALVAAGALSGDEPALADVRAVAAAMSGGVLFGGQAAPDMKKLPEPWRSMLRGASWRGPVGTVAVSAATPVFDGFAVAVSAVESGEDGWTADVEVAPGLEMFSPFDGPRARARPLTWWAADDRGHHALGTIGDWSGGENSGRGSIHFGIPLDRKATYIDLLPTATTQRAVIRVPLEWS